MAASGLPVCSEASLPAPLAPFLVVMLFLILAGSCRLSRALFAFSEACYVKPLRLHLCKLICVGCPGVQTHQCRDLNAALSIIAVLLCMIAMILNRDTGSNISILWGFLRSELTPRLGVSGTYGLAGLLLDDNRTLFHTDIEAIYRTSHYKHVMKFIQCRPLESFY